MALVNCKGLYKRGCPYGNTTEISTICGNCFDDWRDDQDEDFQSLEDPEFDGACFEEDYGF